MIESGLQLSEYQAKKTIFANIFAPFFATFGPDCGFKITVIEIFFHNFRLAKPSQCNFRYVKYYYSLKTVPDHKVIENAWARRQSLKLLVDTVAKGRPCCFG